MQMRCGSAIKDQTDFCDRKKGSSGVRRVQADVDVSLVLRKRETVACHRLEHQGRTRRVNENRAKKQQL